MLFFIYFFGFFLLFSMLNLIFSKNPIYCIFYFIFCIINISGLCLILNIEYLGLIFLLVYVGAIAVLFLFVVMMLNIKVLDIYEMRLKYIPLVLIISFIVFIELYLYLFIDNYSIFMILKEPNYINWIDELNYLTNLESIGLVLYTYYSYIFILISLILLLGIIGSISLTYNINTRIKRQLSFQQNERKILYSIKILK